MSALAGTADTRYFWNCKAGWVQTVPYCFWGNLQKGGEVGVGVGSSHCSVFIVCGNEPSAEVYGAAADRQQASIVFDVARQMVEMSPALMKRSKLMSATKRIVNYGNAGYYQVLPQLIELWGLNVKTDVEAKKTSPDRT